ncbi:HesA/MoeB/ThiF family protein [Vibrio profundi]|uniref:HesA/MoeB/ThiF family protein n=1 Tax=Vibrio profundi TaxID=1774960 RepID=UPI00373703AB
MLNDDTFLRYQRQISLEEFGEIGQSRLLQSHVLLVGCGGLGSAAALYLASSGVGKLVVVDDDEVDLSNLQRQVVYREADITKGKAVAMASQLGELNPDSKVRTIPRRMSDSQLELEVMLADIVLDCSDNFATRQQVNRACFAQDTPLISASAIGWKGQFMVFDFPNQQSCYRCLIPFENVEQETRCSDSGIVGPVVGVMGNLQALSTIQKLATGEFLSDTTQLKIFDGKSLNWTSLAMTQDSDCPVCAQRDAEIQPIKEGAK